MSLVRPPSRSARPRKGVGSTDTASLKMTLTAAPGDGRQRLESLPSTTESQEYLNDFSTQELAAYQEEGKKRTKSLCSI